VHDGLEAKQAVKPGTSQITMDSWLEYGSNQVPTEVLKGSVQTFAEATKGVSIDEQLSDGWSTLMLLNSLQRPSLFDFRTGREELMLHVEFV
jgi:hypothetical protein